MNFQFKVEPLQRLDPVKFKNPEFTAKGEVRASVQLRNIETLWFNTGTLCNLSCGHCYIESTPSNDRLIYLTASEVRCFLDELDADWQATEIGFTGGEPFMNKDIILMVSEVLARGYEVLVLTNAMKPMTHHRAALLALKDCYGDKLKVRVSLDHFMEAAHDLERGDGSWKIALDGVKWLSDQGINFSIAGRTMWQESEAGLRAGFAELATKEKLHFDASDPSALVLFPEMDMAVDVPEITTACWSLLGKNPNDVMCASSRMIVHRKGEDRAVVLACTLLPYDDQFELGHRLADAAGAVKLNHPHCAKFCVLGGASCSVNS